MRGSVLLGIASAASAAIIPRQNLAPNETDDDQYTLPNGQNVGTRSAQINDIRNNFEYGEDILGPGGAYYPTGSYADEMIIYDKALLFSEALPWIVAATTDATASAALVGLEGGLSKLQDYAKFHDGFKISVPDGPYPGVLENGGEDLVFSMERLSSAPFGVRRLDPSTPLPFNVDDGTTKNLTTMALTTLLQNGLLFYIDHSDLADIPLIEGRYAAAADAYFYMHPQTKDFLPLAIRMNRGSDLIYTPADTETDWLFAKLAFNMNNLWFEQWWHLEMIHYVTDIVFMAAVRTLNPDHPIYGLLDRLSFQTFALRPAAIAVLVGKGGKVDEFFFSPGSTVSIYADKLYWEGGAGDWLNTEFTTDLQKRGLINCTYGPELKHLPYFEDASVINDAIDDFVTAYVDSYYSSDIDVANDPELSAFVAEAIPAKIINFPTKISTRSDLIALLRHFAMTVSVVHGATNTNEPVHTTGTLPWHPMAFYQPLPTQKGLTDIMPLMPNVIKAAGQIGLFAGFNRPFISDGNLEGENRTLLHMFDLPEFLERTNDQVRQANGDFMSKMRSFSEVVQARTFGEDGLCQGMPMVWKVLDPLRTPFYVTI